MAKELDLILFTLVKEDGTDGISFPFQGEVKEATEKFDSFTKHNPMAVLGHKTVKARKVVEVEELYEITLPEPDIQVLLKDALKFLKRNGPE